MVVWHTGQVVAAHGERNDLWESLLVRWGDGDEAQYPDVDSNLTGGASATHSSSSLIVLWRCSEQHHRRQERPEGGARVADGI